MRFKDFSGNSTTYQDILNVIKDNEKEYEIFVGTDSQVKKGDKKVLYATCIVLYRKGKGGRIFISKEKKQHSTSLRDRLSQEVWRSLEVAMALMEVNSDVEITVHIDTNQSSKFKSGNYSQELMAMVLAQGFKCQIKPDSFAAQNVADRYSKRDI